MYCNFVKNIIETIPPHRPLHQPMTSRELIKRIPQILKFITMQPMLQASIRPQVKSTVMETIASLKQAAYHNGVVSLAANQIGIIERVFVCVKPEFMQPGRWTGYKEMLQQCGVGSAEDAYEAVIAPLEISSSQEGYYGWQECPSFDGMKFKVKIPLLINVRHLTEKVLQEYLSKKNDGNMLLLKQASKSSQHPNKKDKSNNANDTKNKVSCANIITVPDQLYSTSQLTGFKGRVWDHEIRHLEGLLPLDQNICSREFYLLDQYKLDMENLAYYKEIHDAQGRYSEEKIKNMSAEMKETIGKAMNGLDSLNLNEHDRMRDSHSKRQARQIKRPTIAKHGLAKRPNKK